MNTLDWYHETVGDSSVNAAAQKARVSQATLNRQVSRESLTPEVVVALARAYGQDVLDALIPTGLVDESDIRAHAVREALRAASDAEVAAEVWRRMVDGQPPPALTDPIEDPASPPR